MRIERRSSFSVRKLKIIFTIFLFIILSFIINSYFRKGQKDIIIEQGSIQTLKKQDIFPIYKNSKLSLSMSHTGDPFIYVFLSKDESEKIIDFYKEALKGSYTLKKIVYKNKIMTIYQFRSIEEDQKLKIEAKLKLDKLNGKDIKILDYYIIKGVEIVPLNRLWEKALQAKTKIKIIIPRKVLFKKDIVSDKEKTKQENKE